MKAYTVDIIRTCLAAVHIFFLFLQNTMPQLYACSYEMAVKKGHNSHKIDLFFLHKLIKWSTPQPQ